MKPSRNYPFKIMKNQRWIAPLLGIFLVCALGTSAQGQYLYQFMFTGTCATTDASGKIVDTPINNQTLMQSYAKNHGVTNTSGLSLAYHIGGNELGDTIDVINRTNGATVFTIFGLYFGEDFGRMELLSTSHRQMRRLEYIYTDQNSHSLGSALVTAYFFFDNSGHTNNTVVFGSLQYLALPDTTHTNVQICSGSFTTLRPWQFH